MARVRTRCGTSRSRRTADIDALFVAQCDTAVLLLPSRKSAHARVQRILSAHELDGLVDASVMSFEDFVIRILKSRHRAPRTLSDLDRQLLLSDLLAAMRNANKLGELGDAAATPGFRQHMLHIITQLKQAALEPHDLRKLLDRRDTRSWLDGIVADVYDAYHAELLRTGAFDRVGLYWSAADLCLDQKPASIAHISIMLLDEFDDFTPSEFRLLQSLAPHLDTIVFGINADIGTPRRRDRYAIAIQTLEQIHKRFGPVQDADLQSPPPVSLRDVAEEDMFWRDRPQIDPALEPNVQLIACRTPIEEMEYVGRSVKSLILDQEVAPGRIAVVCRQIAPVADILRSMFAELGVPATVRADRPITSSAAVSAFLLFLEAMQHWDYATVGEMLASRWLLPNDNTLLRAVPLLTRAAGLFDRYAEWTKGLERLRTRVEQQRGADAALIRENVPNAPETITALLDRLHKLHEIFVTLPNTATQTGFALALDAMIEACGLQHAATASSDPLTTETERAAIAALRELVTELHGAGQLFNNPLNRSDFLDLFTDAAATHAFSPPKCGNGVVCCDADAVRGLAFDHVFICGVNEGAFPVPPSTNAIYQEEDLREFARLGVQLDDRRRHQARELLLFQHIIEAAAESVTVSWHLASIDGRAKLESPLVTDLRELLAGHAIERTEIASSRLDLNTIASERDLRNTLFAAGTASAALRYPGVQRAIEVEMNRQFAKGFDSYDGVIGAKNLLDRIRGQFGPDHLYSVSQLETYANCPFNFFMQRILHLQEIEAPTGEFDPMVRGEILHATLCRFHSEFVGKTAAELDETESRMAIERHLNEVFNDFAWKSSDAPRGLREAERRNLLKRLNRYLTIHLESNDAQWRPMWFEVAFGYARGEIPEPPGTTQPFLFDTPEGSIQIAGRIDRIDQCDQGWRIIDYKTSVSTRTADIQNGLVLQLPIYASAVEKHLLPGNTCLAALLVAVGTAKQKNVFAGNDIDRSKVDDIVAGRVAKCLDGIRQGKFTPTPSKDKCFGCGNHKPCRHDTGRIARKTEANDETD